MGLLESIDPLLEVNVVGRKLGLRLAGEDGSAICYKADHGAQMTNYLIIDLTELLLGELEGARRKGRNLSAEIPR
jgi:hypothetical protein